MSINIKGENIIRGKLKSFVIDKTLTKSGQCADAKVTGDMLAEIKAKQSECENLIKAYQSISSLNNLVKNNATIWEGSLTTEDSSYGAHRTGELETDPFDYSLFAFECEIVNNNKKEMLIAYKRPIADKSPTMMIVNEYELKASSFRMDGYDESGAVLERLTGIKLRLVKVLKWTYFKFEDDFVSYRGDTVEKGVITIKKIIGII